MTDNAPAVISSASSTLDDLVERVRVLADEFAAAEHEAVSEELYAAERALSTARRALARALAAM